MPGSKKFFRNVPHYATMNQVVNQKQNMNHRQPKYTSFGYKLSTITVTLLSTITILTALFENLVMTLPFVFTRMVSKLGVYNPTLLRNTHTDTHTHTRLWPFVL